MAMDFPIPDGYRVLESETVAAVLAEIPNLVAVLGGVPGDWSVREVSDGNMNRVFLVEGPSGGVAAKQALPWIRVVEDWKFPISRIDFEVAALRQTAAFAPGRVPQVLAYVPALGLAVLELLKPHIVLREGLVAGRVYPKLADQVGDFLALSLYRGSDFALDTETKKALLARFAGNAHLCATTEDVVFTGPYDAGPLNRWTSPQLDDDVRALHGDTEAKLAAAELKWRFRTATESLIHGDLHTGSFMVTESDTRAIDFEWALYGPMGFDIGALIGNLLLAWISQAGHAEERSEDRRPVADWLEQAIPALWERFVAGFLDLAERETGGGQFPAALFPERAPVTAALSRFLDHVWRDAVGFAGSKMIRRLVGISHVADFEAIADPDLRAGRERIALRLARSLTVERDRYSDPVALVRAVNAALR